MRIFDNVRTSELDELAANICSSMIADQPDYGILAARIIISNHHKNTSPSFSETIYVLYSNRDTPLISEQLYDTVMKNKEKLNTYIDYQRDYGFDYFGFKTLERSYLLKSNGRLIERPQHLFMRVALGIHGNDIKDALLTYDLMSKKYFTHATPTLFNAGTPRPQLSSCFLLSVDGDSIDKIFDTVKECAMISKYAGGIGIHVHDIRAKGSIIRGTNGISDGIVPLLKVLNQTARYVNQCFTPETVVYTLEGIKPMNKITCSDSLLTNDNTYKPVNGISINKIEAKEILQVRTVYGFDDINVTPEHEICVLRDDISKFISASDLKIGDLVGYPIPSYIKDFEAYTLDYCRFHGIWIGNGEVNVDSSTGLCSFLVHFKSAETATFMKRYLEETHIEFEEGPFFIKWFENTNKNKDMNIICQDFLHLPIDKTLSLMKGLFESGGKWQCHCGYFQHFSYQVIMSVRYLLLRLGILAKGASSKRLDNSCTKFELVVPRDCILNEEDVSSTNTKDIDYFVSSSNIIWSKIQSIDRVKYTGCVYDFNMLDNHNYTVASLGVVHNSGKRNGSIAVYLEPWHSDVFEFLELKKPHGSEEDRARDLFYALWIPDVFMERVKNNKKWSLMCPNKCPGLSDVYGDKFKTLYEQYESEGNYNKQIDAQQLWFKILETQIETGGPYLLFKDACNQKSNQQNLGTIKSSNLCSEIVEYSSPDESGTCNLASICLPTYIENKTFNFEKLHEVTKIITKNLNKVIDINFYPVEKTRRSNLRHRPIGIGIQGLADVYVLMQYAFDSEEAKQLNRMIFETIYHAAVEESCEISRTRHQVIMNVKSGQSDKKVSDIYLNTNEYDPPSDSKYPGAYSSFVGSQAQQGKLQFDLWSVDVTNERYDWDALKKEILEYGMRNSLLLAPMPTASTSQIMGFNEGCEAFTSNIYKRKTLAGEFIIVNKYLIRDLIQLSLWSKEMKNKIILNEGSVQSIPEIPNQVKALYKTVWEIKQKVIIDQAADRGAFICQSQSMNLFVESPTFQTLSSMHFYSWSKGLKTCSYYIRSKPKARQQQFTIEPAFKKEIEDKKKTVICTEDVCTICSS